MANFFKTLFGGGKKQEAVQTYFPSQDPRFKLAQTNLEDILAKRGYYGENEMGYTPEMISGVSAPYAAARREGFQRYEIPQISAQASARGLGRSTIPINRIALSGQEAERDIQQRIAELTTQSEQLKGQQKGQNLQAYLNAIQGISGLGTQEIGAQQDAMTRAAMAQEANRLADKQMTQRAASLGILGLSAFGGPQGLQLGSTLSGGLLGQTPTQKSSALDIMDTLEAYRKLYGGAGVQVSQGGKGGAGGGAYDLSQLAGKLPISYGY